MTYFWLGNSCSTVADSSNSLQCKARIWVLVFFKHRFILILLFKTPCLLGPAPFYFPLVQSVGINCTFSSLTAAKAPKFFSLSLSLPLPYLPQLKKGNLNWSISSPNLVVLINPAGAAECRWRVIYPHHVYWKGEGGGAREACWTDAFLNCSWKNKAHFPCCKLQTMHQFKVKGTSPIPVWPLL